MKILMPVDKTSIGGKTINQIDLFTGSNDTLVAEIPFIKDALATNVPGTPDKKNLFIRFECN